MFNPHLLIGQPYSNPGAWFVIVLGLAFLLPGILRVGLTPLRKANMLSFIVGVGTMVFGVVLIAVGFLIMMR